MAREPAPLDLDDEDDMAPAAPAGDLAGLKPTPPGPKPDAEKVRAATESAGFTRDTPKSVPPAAAVAPSATAAATGPELPWRAPDIRPGQKATYPLRVDEQLKAMLNWLDREGAIKSMNRFIEEALETAVPEKVADHLVKEHGLDRAAAKRAVKLIVIAKKEG